MHRRRYLQAATVASAISLPGCLSRTADSESDSGSIVVSDTAMPDGADLELRTELSGPTSDSPAKLEVGVTTKTAQTLKFGPYQPLSTPAAKRQDGSAELLLIPEQVWDHDVRYYVPERAGIGDYVPDTPSDGC